MKGNTGVLLVFGLLALAGGLALCESRSGCLSNQKIITPSNNMGDRPMSIQSYELGQVTHVSGETFHQEVLRSEVPVLVDFYADWCGPCQAMAPVLEQVAREVLQAKVVKVNVDDSPELAARYQVNAIPTLIVFKQGKVAAQVVGLANKNRLKNLLSL